MFDFILLLTLWTINLPKQIFKWKLILISCCLLRRAWDMLCQRLVKCCREKSLYGYTSIFIKIKIRVKIFAIFASKVIDLARFFKKTSIWTKMDVMLSLQIWPKINNVWSRFTGHCHLLYFISFLGHLQMLCSQIKILD